MAKPVPTVIPPAIGVERDKSEAAPGAAAVVAGAFAGTVSAAIKGRLTEVARAKASSFFMFMLLERVFPEGWCKGIAVSVYIAS
ncbi:hypothetical protein D3C85_1146220 [compost metagenome]